MFRQTLRELTVHDMAFRPRTAQRVQVREIFDSSRPQFKLAIGKPNDVYQQEALPVGGAPMKCPKCV